MTNIVMLCHNRYRLLRQSLVSLYEHTDQTKFNLTLVDDNSTDFKVWGLMLDYGGRANSTLLRVHNSNHVLAQLKNLGVAWAEQCFGRGDWLYLSDSDVYFKSGWLEKLTQVADTWEQLGFKLFGGQIHPFHQPIKKTAYDIEGDVITEHEVLDGPSWLMRWDTWENAGGFKRANAPGPCQSEEYPFCGYLDSIHGRIGVIQPHVVIHTGLTNSNGKDAPGRKEREAQMVAGVLYE